MKNITETFGTLYHPVKAFVIYKPSGNGQSVYVESYDMDGQGSPMNAHPLTIAESRALAKALDTSGEMRRSFLKPKGLMPAKVLSINPEQNGFAVWYTPAQEKTLLFSENLGIPRVKVAIPSLIWKASKNSLYVYAVKSSRKPSINAVLYHAPFFNLYEDGRVCMGTVSVNISPDCLLDEFMSQWEEYFFNSYFSHLIMQRSPVKGNLVQLWQKLVKSKKDFPISVLEKNGMTLKNLLV